MTFLSFLYRHFLQYSVILEFLFLFGVSTFFFGYLKRNKTFKAALIVNGMGIVVFLIWLVRAYIDYLALGNWSGSLGLAYLSGFFFLPTIVLSLFVSIALLLIAIITEANKKNRAQKIVILLTIGIIIILLAGLFLYQYLPTRIEFASWKKYTNIQKNFSIDYPSTWSYSWDALNPRDVFFNGDNGSISIDYGDGTKSFCENGLGDMKIGSETFTVCVHDVPGTRERWFLSNKNLGINITAIANNPTNKNREIILKMLSTFKFTN